LRLFQRTGDRPGEARALDALGADATEQGDEYAAANFFQQALESFRTIGDQWGMVNVLGNLGQLYRDQGRYDEALACYQEGLERSQMIADQQNQAFLCGSQGWTLLDLGDESGAAEAFRTALQSYQALGSPPNEGWMHASLGYVRALQGDHEAAYTHSTQALQMAEVHGEPFGAGDAWLVQGRALEGLRRYAEAAHAYDEALNIWQELERLSRVLEARAGLVHIALTQEDWPTAQEQVAAILLHLRDEHGTYHDTALRGADDPLGIIMVCYRVLAAMDDTQAAPMLDAAHAFVRQRAGTISDTRLREAFLRRAATHGVWLANHTS
jgi:tetratricopeptide (TPR) repeat protein